jgi:hypothetical protein
MPDLAVHALVTGCKPVGVVMLGVTLHNIQPVPDFQNLPIGKTLSNTLRVF